MAVDLLAAERRLGRSTQARRSEAAGRTRSGVFGDSEPKAGNTVAPA